VGKFFCIADEDTVRGFRLAGVEGQAVASSEETTEALRRAVRRADIGIVVLTQPVAHSVQKEIEAIRMSTARPLVVEIPGPEGPMRDRKTLRQFVMEAIGISIGQEEERT
jgi:vacuolar-type H+-ATPase subunit F/Vma7